MSRQIAVFPAMTLRHHLVPLLVVLPVWLGCAGAPGPSHPSPEAATDRAATATDSASVTSDTANAPSDTAAAAPIDQTIPPDYLPPPGQCRAWRPGQAPEDQARAHPVGRCSELRRALPEDVWLIYRPPDASGIVRVWQYGKEGGVVSQRIHDAATGALLRHVAPAGS